MDTKALRDLLSSEAGKPVYDFLNSYYLDLNRLDSIREYADPKELAIEFKAHRKAIAIIEEMLNQIMVLKTPDSTPLPEDNLNV